MDVVSATLGTDGGEETGTSHDRILYQLKLAPTRFLRKLIAI